LAIKEIEFVTKTGNGILPRSRSPGINEWTFAKADRCYFRVGFWTLKKWVQQARNEDLMSGPHGDQAKEITRLHKENRILREERKILKKATVFFASLK